MVVLGSAEYDCDASNRLRQFASPAHAGLPAETLVFDYDDTTAGNYGKGRLIGISDGSGQIAFAGAGHGGMVP